MTSESADGRPGASPTEARAFAAAFRDFLQWVHAEDSTRAERHPVRVLLGDFLGPDAAGASVVSRSMPEFEHVNLRAAINEWSTAARRSVDVHGLRNPAHHDRPDLESLVADEHMTPTRLGAPTFVDLPDGPGSTLACLRLALLLVTDERGKYVLLLNGPNEHSRGIRVEVAGLPVPVAQAVLSELDELRRRLNVYRGHVLAVSGSDIGAVTLSFAEEPAIGRDDVVLPEDVLERVERHALQVAHHRQALRARGQHLKRGVLLYGPPGTGKTHTTRYLVGEMTGYTRFLMSGRALHTVGALSELARDLQPSVVVLEDVDLVAEDRGFGDGSSPVLFDLLDAMDGAASDADLLFVLTTNRADLLEPALAARPGRVDVAVEVGLPDADARRRLLELYGRGVSLALDEDDVADVVGRTEGVTASFVKELLRRSVLEALLDSTGNDATGTDGAEVTAMHVGRALDDLLDSAQAVTRTLLGVGFDSHGAPKHRTVRPGPGLAPGAYASRLHISYDDEP